MNPAKRWRNCLQIDPVALQHARPDEWVVHSSWQALVSAFWQSQPGQQLAAFLEYRIRQGASIFPPQPLRALELTPLNQVRVVVLGQDPYHGRGQAEGLSFSVPKGVSQPPSLRNIFKELQADTGVQPPMSGSLVSWAERGVLLINTCLTVEEGLPASHARKGWEVLTDTIIQAVAQQEQPVVFLLWGAHAQTKRQLIENAMNGQHVRLPPGQSLSLQKRLPHASVGKLILQANHPSPLSALRGPTPFMGCRHFSQAQNWLSEQGVDFQW
ncbi:MAG: uracil-DNA glycosylase, partial [Limnohabitans sp.]